MFQTRCLCTMNTAFASGDTCSIAEDVLEQLHLGIGTFNVVLGLETPWSQGNDVLSL